MRPVLKKELSFFGLFSIATGAMISSGIFVLPGVAYNIYGPYVFISYAMAGILAFIGLLSFLELATAMPKAGADYFYTSRSLGPFIGTISGIFAWVAITLKSAFAIFGLSVVLSELFSINFYLVIIAVTVIFVALNILGVKEATIVQVVLVTLLILGIILHMVFGVRNINMAYFKNSTKNSSIDLLKGAALVFVTFGGLIKSTSLSEEVKNPAKDIPISLISSVLFVTVLSTLYTFVIIGTVPPEQLRSTLTPAADSANIALGQAGYFIITLVSILAFATTANAGIMSASRYLFALSRDHLIPPIFSATSTKRATPYFSVIFTGIVIVMSIVTLKLEYLVKFASATILMTYVLGSVVIIIFRESKIRSYVPKFKVPLYPYLPIFSIIIFTFLFIETGLGTIEVIFLMLIISILVYRFYGRSRSAKDFALLYVMKRILSERDAEGLLETELEEIVIHREEIPKDKFQDMIRNALILDIDREVEFSELTDIVVEKIPFDREECKSILVNSEKVENFIINDYFALPHGIIGGEKKFLIGVVRSKSGIIFRGTGRKVVCAIYILSSADMREFYLKVLASIAELVRSENFWDKWQKAQNVDEIRKLLMRE
ncbi:MAG: amino acid permease [bacterium]|nr:amino acid permease [bacterium]